MNYVIFQLGNLPNTIKYFTVTLYVNHMVLISGQ